MRSKIFSILIIAIFTLTAGSFAQEKLQQHIEWRADPNAMEYKVELRTKGQGNTRTIESSVNSVKLSLEPGFYEYRVFAYDFLGRQASVSPWQVLTVLKAATPEIVKAEKNIELKSGDRSFTVQTEIKSVTGASSAQLVKTQRGETVSGSMNIESSSKSKIPGSEVEKATSLEFPRVKSGEWKIRITNPSGYTSESDVIKITEKPPVPTKIELVNLETKQTVSIPLSGSTTEQKPQLSSGEWTIRITGENPELLESEPLSVKETVQEVVKEVPVEVEKEVIKEVIKEVPVEVEKEVIKEVIKEVPVEVVKEVIKEVPVEKEVVREVVKEVPIHIEQRDNISMMAPPPQVERISLVNSATGQETALDLIGQGQSADSFQSPELAGGKWQLKITNDDGSTA